MGDFQVARAASLPGCDPRAEATARSGLQCGRGEARGRAVQRQGNCNSYHREPLWTEPGWNLHPATDIGIDSFQADRAPDNVYKTMNLAGVFVRENGLFMDPANKGRFYHDGRFATLVDVVKHYNTHSNLGLTPQEMDDLVEYLKSL